MLRISFQPRRAFASRITCMRTIDQLAADTLRRNSADVNSIDDSHSARLEDGRRRFPFVDPSDREIQRTSPPSANQPKRTVSSIREYNHCV